MTTSALVLIVAMLLLGGMIAALGDRLGTKVGKARLRLFNLRPRQTAVVVTIITGTVIAASTLGILFALSKNLRQGVFRIDEIRKQRREAQEELYYVREQKAAVEEELKAVNSSKEAVEAYLDKLNRDFYTAKQELERVSQQAKSLELEVEALQAEKATLLAQRNKLNQQIAISKETIVDQAAQIENQNQVLQEKQSTIQQLAQQQQDLQKTIKARDEKISELDRAIATQQDQLLELETQISYLTGEIKILEQYYRDYQELRESQIAIVRGQILAFNVVQIIEPEAVTEAINYLLREANATAIQAANPNSDNQYQRIVQITESQVEQLARQIADGREYVVRILAAENYATGEEEIRVFADVALNQEIFVPKVELASVSLDGQDMNEAEIQARLDWLLAASEFRARRSGILGDIQIEEGKVTTIIDFLEAVTEASNTPEEIRAIVSEPAYTSGPLKISLVAMIDGEIIVSTSKS